MSDIIFHPIVTYGGKYIYDRHTNSVVRVTDEEFSEFENIANGKINAHESSLIHRFQNIGMFHPNTVEKIEHPKTYMLNYHVNNRLGQLVLQVTQQCNLRCEYCAYSGIYNNNRIHTNSRMDWTTAKKAIDFFVERSIETEKCTISFYGGEPLLEFELIKKCIEYAEEIVEGKELIFNMTTNGTLLKSEIADFLVNHNCHISISLDGSKEEHDVNRRFVSGKGSFDIIISNIKNLQTKYPAFAQNIHILTTINPRVNLGCIMEYFSTDEIFRDKYIVFNSMTTNNLKEKITYDQQYYYIRRFEYIKMLFCVINKLDTIYVSPLVHSGIGETAISFKALQSHAKLSTIAHPGGPCIPGVKKLFVRTDGTLYPCEKVSESLDYFKIGTLNTGLDVNKMNNLLNIGKCTEEKCKNCSALLQCTICSGQIDFGDNFEPTFENKAPLCYQNLSLMHSKLHELCVLSEFKLNPEVEVRK